jgi:hypothetical protein
MNTNKIGRRQIIVTAAGAGLAALLSRGVSAQPDPASAAKEAGSLHAEELKATSDKLDGTPITSEDGLNILIDRLSELKLIEAERGRHSEKCHPKNF